MNDFFERLGLPRRFAVDAAALEREYLARSRAVHPDFHMAGSSVDLAASMDSTAALNEAYTTLKDPTARAEYLLTLYGGPTAQQDKGTDPEFLAAMMEIRERIETADAADRESVREELREREQAQMARIASGFDRYEAGEQTQLAAIRKALNALKTIRSLKRQLPDD